MRNKWTKKIKDIKEHFFIKKKIRNARFIGSTLDVKGQTDFVATSQRVYTIDVKGQG